LFVVHFSNNSIHLAGDRRGVNRRDRADSILVYADVAFLCCHGRHRNRPASTSGCFGRWLLLMAQYPPETQTEDQQDRDPHDDAYSRASPWCRRVRRRGLLVLGPDNWILILVSRQSDSSSSR